jgi:hypothetical protein
MLWSGGDPKTQTHPYLEAELPRKLLNNTTTTSNVFTVQLTIVYHEVRPAAPEQVQALKSDGNAVTLNRHYLGREAFREVPGDMRQQYLAIVDRSTAVVKADRGDQNLIPTPYYSALGQGVAAGVKDFTLANSQKNGTNSVIVYADGQLVEVKANDQLVVGSGVEAETVTVSSVNDGTITLTAGFVRPHAAGAVVSNASPGRPVDPAAQTSPTVPVAERSPIRNPASYRYRLLIPYAGRVR